MGDHAEGSGSEEDYEVEGIVGHKDSTRSGRKYEVKWKGYEETTFEPRENLVPNSERLVVKYDRKHPFKRSKKSGLKHKQEGKSRKGDKNAIFDSESEDESKDSNIENKKPIVEAKQRKFSKRVKTKLKSHKTTRKGESARSKKVLEASALRNGKKKGKKKNSSRRMILESSSDSSNGGEYEVELLLKHRDLEDRRMYLVKWKGYRKSEATWEPSSNLSCRTLVRQYEHLRGKWKRPRKRASGSSDKQPSKRMRTSENSEHETKENVVKVVRRLSKRKDGTWSKESEDDTAEKEDATNANGDEKETSAADKNEKREVSPRGEKPEKGGKTDANLDGEGKEEDKLEIKDEVEQTKVPDSKKGSQGESEKTKDQSPQGKKDESPQGEKPEEDVEEKQVEDNKD